MKRILPFFLLLTGCSSVSIGATKMDQLQNTYELAHRRQFVAIAGDESIGRSIAATAEAVCGQAGVALLDVKRPDYITVPMSPRGYLHCRQ